MFYFLPYYVLFLIICSISLLLYVLTSLLLFPLELNSEQIKNSIYQNSICFSVLIKKMSLKLLIYDKTTNTVKIHQQLNKCRHHAVVITTAQLHSTKSELRFWAASTPVRSVLEICNSENLWQWPMLKIRLISFCWSIIP